MVDEHTGDEIWLDDLLDRQQDARFLAEFLLGRVRERQAEGKTGSYVLNLDAPWGQGKTFFLQRLYQQLSADGFLGAYVNAWEGDYADDPLLAVMSEVDAVVTAHYKGNSAIRKTWNVVKRSSVEIMMAAGKHGAKQLAKKTFGEGTEELLELISSEESQSNDQSPSAAKSKEPNSDVKEFSDATIEAILDRHAKQLLEGFQRQKSTIENFRSKLGQLLATIQSKSKSKVPFFILIDEMDRCRPTYAISLLERIKHIFDVDNVVFIIATDSSQLKHSIKAVYGEQFDSGRYLLRFFDRTYRFDGPQLEQFAASLFHRGGVDTERLSSPPNNQHIEFFVGCMRFYGLSLRDAEQCFDMLRSILTVWRHRARIELLYLLPLIVAYQRDHLDLFEALAKADVERAQKLHPGGNDVWQASFIKVGERGARHLVGEEVTSLLWSFLKSTSTPLPQIDDGRSSGGGRWVLQRFLDELSVEYSSGYVTQNPPLSLVNTYPSLVRNVGRLRYQEQNE